MDMLKIAFFDSAKCILCEKCYSIWYNMWFKLLQQLKSIDINYDPIPWDNIYCAIIFKFIAQGNKEVLNGIRAHTWQARPLDLCETDVFVYSSNHRKYRLDVQAWGTWAGFHNQGITLIRMLIIIIADQLLNDLLSCSYKSNWCSCILIGKLYILFLAFLINVWITYIFAWTILD